MADFTMLEDQKIAELSAVLEKDKQDHRPILAR